MSKAYLHLCLISKAYLHPLYRLSFSQSVSKPGLKSPRFQGWNVKLV